MIQLDLRASLVGLPRGDRRGLQRLKRAKPPSWPPTGEQPPQRPFVAAQQGGSSAAIVRRQTLTEEPSADETADVMAAALEAPDGVSARAAHNPMDPYGDLGATPLLAGYSSPPEASGASAWRTPGSRQAGSSAEDSA